MKKLTIPTKKIIALMVVVVLCGLSVYQGIVEKKVPVEFVATASIIVGYYFGYGKGQIDKEDN